MHRRILFALSLLVCGQQACSSSPMVNGGSPSGTDDLSIDAANASGTGTTGAVIAAPKGFVFGPYKDVTVSANWNTNEISTALSGAILPVAQVKDVDNVTWSFATGECGSETWAGISADALAKVNVPAFVAANKHYMLSTGGAAGSFTCATDAGFAAFVDRYRSANLLGVDFDIESAQTPEVIDALVARVSAAQKNEANQKLRFSFTLATLGGNSSGLGDAGKNVMASIQRAQLKNYLINLMVMDYGSASASTCTLNASGACDMGLSANQAAKLLHDEYQVPYAQIELTPMIGGNDSAGQVFTLEDVTTVMNFAKSQGLAGVHYWSLDRDTDCSQTTASPICNSYGKAGVLGFFHAFAKSL